MKTFLKIIGLGVAILALLFCGVAFMSWWAGPIRFLSSHATNIHDFYDDAGGGITGDFTRYISAQCSEDVFHEYAKSQGLIDRVLPDSNTQVGMGDCEKSWWTPPKNLEGAYYYSKPGGKDAVLAYSSGHIYYFINVH
jgi:hypothetical protein